jgi:hypothetical protein
MEATLRRQPAALSFAHSRRVIMSGPITEHSVSARSYEWINPDDFLLTPSGRLWTPERNKVAWEQAYALLRQVLSRAPIDAPPGHKHDLYLVCGLQGAGKSTWIRNNAARFAPCIFFDAALPRAIHRLPIITIARSAGAPVHAVWINAALKDALHRNSLRRDDEQVPEASIRSVAAQFEPPTVSEGFVDVLAVQNGDPPR